MEIRVGPGGWRGTKASPEDPAALPAYLSTTELLSTRAAWPTVLMVVLNLPAVVPPAVDDLYPGLAPFSAALVVLGVLATVGLRRRVGWGTPLVLTVAVLNVLLGEVALAKGLDSGIAGIALGLLALALATPVPRRTPRW